MSDNIETVDHVKTQPSWGLQSPETSVGPRFGARAIYAHNRHRTPDKRKRGRPSKAEALQRQRDSRSFTIDLVWDRMEMVGGTDAERKAMSDWFNKVGYDLLAQQCSDHYVTPDCGDQVIINKDGYTIVANPRESYGYLYIACYRVPG